jgi:hypothetical protein
MKNERPPHYLSIFPTGTIPVPVSIGDLPLSNYVISEDTLTEAVSEFLEENPDVPGVVIEKKNQPAGLIPRHKIFERLGHRYGVELFFRKPIVELEKELITSPFVLKQHISINLAAKMALGRAQNFIYDPIIVELENKTLRILDMYVLLLSQSQLSNNLSGAASSLNNIEMLVSNSNVNLYSAIDVIMESISKVVPAHHARILLQSRTEFDALKEHELILNHYEPLTNVSVYRSILQSNQVSVLEDVKMVPAWTNQDTPPNTRSWMGVPLTYLNENLGVLSLARTTFSPFSNHEKEIALVFARYLSKLLSNSTGRLDKIRMIEKKYLHSPSA